MIPAKAEAVINSVDLKDARQQLDGVRGISVDQDGEYVKVTALGISRHAAFPEGSVNAVHVLAKALTGSGLLTGSGAEAVKAVAEMTSDYNGGCAAFPLKIRSPAGLPVWAAWSMQAAV